MILKELNIEHLKGLEFVHGKEDCYGMIRSFFKDVFDINIEDYARPEEWWDNGMDLYNDNFHIEGFRVLDVPERDWQIGDVFLMAIQSEKPNHAAIYVGEGMILHHFIGRRSNVEIYKGCWRKWTVYMGRHKELQNLEIEASEHSLMDDPRIKNRMIRDGMV
jgi:cell wall-associated NlpC family hydrolase